MAQSLPTYPTAPRPPMNERFPSEVQSIITDAWAQEPSARPPIRDILARLRRVQASGDLEGLQIDTSGPACGCCIG